MSTPLPQKAKSSRWKIGLAVAIIALVVAFLLQNGTTVEIEFLFWSLSMSRSVMVLTFLAIGFLLGAILRRRKHLP